MVDYNGRIGAVYSAGRVISAAEVRRWVAAFATYLPERRPLDVLDLGSGTGRFTPGLAAEFQGRVYGVEPSDRMRAAAEEAPHPGVTYVKGSAEDIPLPEASVDAVLMFLSFHHFRDPLQGLREVRRVLRPGGVALLRTQFSDLMPELFWYEYFPAARAVDAAMYRSVDETRALATQAGLVPGADVVRITGEDARTLRESYERLRLRALSTFEHLSADEVEPGFARLAEDAERDPDRVMPVHSATVLVLTRPR
ncbi:class I SAM-dependent methyltransferase [Kribbella shirazensis]|uniref:Ubiquinone/menaquinone biosynthesis C-methylase UbiE n=1 Tax=Kribbella shirazensis TaxID=1105143 RepID=A0A7X5VFK3_9ACTN|nr:class I SAM-dependent methyltransferase [Kribbella shirazensis]NIK60310.1 ubiquinone/menaquinone biosynthesis C-methylase UbiE [Kribbella shirazensis]